MNRSIFFLDENQQVIQLKEEKYDSEDLFQSLIERYPDVLAGDQISPEHPRKWIFISREMGVPSQEGGNAQWFLDHLFIDQDSIPTFVEVKRSTDTRIRREVVAQMLDYAANASAYWPTEQLRSTYEEYCNQNGTIPLAELEIDIEQTDSFWEKVHTNLRLGKLRLLFVADEIPDSLQRIIEFLNNQMTDTEVLGLEIKQYVSGQNQRTLVPKIIGQTSTSMQVKKSNDISWTEERYLARVTNTSGQNAADVCRKLLRAFENMGCWIYWGKGQHSAGFTAIYEGQVRHHLCSVYSYEKNTKVELLFQHFKAPFDSKEKQLELIRQFSKSINTKLPESRIFKRPSIDCKVLYNEHSFQQFVTIYQNMLNEIQCSENK